VALLAEEVLEALRRFDEIQRRREGNGSDPSDSRELQGAMPV
jgi:hypothetical protein